MEIAQYSDLEALILGLIDAIVDGVVTVDFAKAFVKSHIESLGRARSSFRDLPHYAVAQFPVLEAVASGTNDRGLADQATLIVDRIRSRLTDFYCRLSEPGLTVQSKAGKDVLPPINWTRGPFNSLELLMAALDSLLQDAPPQVVASHFKYCGQYVTFSDARYSLIETGQPAPEPPRTPLRLNGHGTKAELARLTYAVFGSKGTDFASSPWVAGLQRDFLSHFLPPTEVHDFQKNLTTLRGAEIAPTTKQLRRCVRIIRDQAKQ